MTDLPVHRFDRHLVEQLPEWRGTVRLVHRHSAELHPDQEAPRLVLLHPSRALVPCGIGIPWGLVCPRIGQRVVKQGRRLMLSWGLRRRRILVLEGEGVSLRLSDDRSSTSPVNLRDRLEELPLPSRTRALLGLDSVHGDGVDQRVMRTAASRLRRLTDSMRGRRSVGRSIRDDVTGLAGLGPGSTPTGDDLLLGMAAASWRLTGSGWMAREALQELLGSLQDLPDERTTGTSREMFAHAARGAFPEPLVRFVEALERAPSETVAETLGSLTCVGAQSGCDMLAGVVAVTSAMVARTVQVSG